jgi:serine protease Do
MSHSQRPAVIRAAVFAALALIAVLLFLTWSRDGAALPVKTTGLDGPDVDALVLQNKAYERIADQVTPAIVNIQTTSVVRVQQSPYFNDPFFRQFFGDMFGPYNIPRERREHALGSGVIVSSDGTIVTNNHVIARASEIQVMMKDKRVFKAKILGTDPQTDVAVIKIDARDLPTVSWGTSAELKVGDIVMAFGNPFGLNFTVTRGIVSAVGRSGLGIENFEDFIQTDAAINPGNSGGALVDVRGRVVGINTAILTGSSGPGGEGGFNGVGLAIPSDIVRHVMESLVKGGKVARGYLGIQVSDLNTKLAKQFGAPDLSGALVEDVTDGSPADKAGLKQGDVVRSFDGQKIESKDRLTALVASKNPGQSVSIEILREGKAMTLKATLGTRPENLAAGGAPGTAAGQGTLAGVSVQNLTPAIRRRLDIPEGVNGVVITELDPNSAAAQEGLQPGDIIQSIDRRPVRNAEEFTSLAAKVKGDVLLRVVRQGNGFFIVVSPGDANGGGDPGDDEGDNG